MTGGRDLAEIQGSGVFEGVKQAASVGVWALAGFLRNWIRSVPGRREDLRSPSSGRIEVR